jgi:TonB-linked SusC/RagA family outer membrane protein
MMRTLRWLLPLLAVVLVPAAALAQGGTIRGTVQDAATSRPIPSAQVQVVGTTLGTVADAQGNFQVSVPAGTHTLRASAPGFAAAQASVTVAAGQTATTTLRLTASVIALEELVVTGVSTPTSRANVPFEVARVKQAEVTMAPPVSAAGAIQGKVAGARVVQGSGQPGSAPTILLRAPTSINASGRDQEPLYIVDGVILNGSMADINALDIENVEVVKGAAAASLYGSRAANGVVQITTRRGRDMSNRVRYTLRTDYGTNNVEGKIELSQYHPYAMNAAGTKFLCGAARTECDYGEIPGQVQLAGSGSFTTFQTGKWPGQTYDHLSRFFDPGNTLQTYMAVEGASGSTNFLGSYTHLGESGIVTGNKGYSRENFRLNLDHGFGDKVQFSSSGFYSRSHRDEIFNSGANSPFFALTFIPPIIDLAKRDANGDLIITGDPNQPLEYPNPLYMIENRDRERDVSRFLGSTALRYAPVRWFNVEGNLSYDRSDGKLSDYYPKGYKSKQPDASVNNGNLYKLSSISNALNARVTGTTQHSFGALDVRNSVQYLYESQHYEDATGSGRNFVVGDLPTLGALQDNKSIGSYSDEVRAEGYYFTTNLNYDSRYILDGMVRRDGSSLFGPENRWNTYFRLSGAWRLGQESWFSVPGVSDMKLRYSYGTAGNRPSFAARFETYSVSAGSISPVTLGNAALKPEVVTEQEAGVDMRLLNRFDVTVNYARSIADDQLLQVPMPAYAGYSYQWQNAGSLKSNTWEASLEAPIVRRQGFNWSGRVLFDRTRQEITALNRPCYLTGLVANGSTNQNLNNIFYVCPGEAVGSFYGARYASSCADLPEKAQGSCDQFRVNDDGFLVWTGGKAYTEGKSGNNWGTSATIGGTPYNWGIPFVGWGKDRYGNPTQTVALGNTTPKYNLSVSSNMDWHGLNLYALVDASQGFNVYNQTRQWAMFRDRAGEADQVGKSDELQKPVGYYAALYGGAQVNSHFVEDGSFVKLREMALRYTLGGNKISRFIGGVDHVTLGLTGRNLKTWTKYRGYDPEVGAGGGATGSAAIARIDAYAYPNYRTFTLSAEIGF